MHRARYAAVLSLFMSQLQAHPGGPNDWEELFGRQQELVERLTSVMTGMMQMNRQKKVTRVFLPICLVSLNDQIEHLRQTLAADFASFAPLPLMLDPSVRVVGIVAGAIVSFSLSFPLFFFPDFCFFHCILLGRFC